MPEDASANFNTIRDGTRTATCSLEWPLAAFLKEAAWLPTYKGDDLFMGQTACRMVRSSE